jgi:glycosyltransferase 2 family protein
VPRTRGIGIAISLVAIAAGVWWALQQSPPKLPGDAKHISALVLAIALYAVATCIRSERWRALLHRSGGRASRRDCYRLTTVGFMGNTVLPARGGDLMRIGLMAPRANASKRTVLGTLLAERILDVLVLLSVFVVLVYVAGHGGDAQGADTAALVAGVLLGAGAVGAVAIAALRRRGRLRRLDRFVELARPALATTRGLAGRRGLVLLAATAGLWVVEAATWLTAGWAAGLDFTPVDALYLMALASVFALVPAAPGYIGTMDAAVLIGVRALGRAGSTAVGYVLLLRFVLFIPITAVGLVFLLVHYGGWSASREARATAVA